MVDKQRCTLVFAQNHGIQNSNCDHDRQTDAFSCAFKTQS
jgi:hypothetical protein